MTNKSELTFVYPPALWPLSGWQGACHHLAPSLPGASSCQKFGVQDLLILPDISFIYIYIYIYIPGELREFTASLLLKIPLYQLWLMLRSRNCAFYVHWLVLSVADGLVLVWSGSQLYRDLMLAARRTKQNHIKWLLLPKPCSYWGVASANIDSTSTMLNASSTPEVSKPNARNRWNSRSGTCCPWRTRSLIYFGQHQVTAKS